MSGRILALPISLLLLSGVILSGCGMGTGAISPAVSGPAIQGTIMGGHQPVTGSLVTLYAVSSGGYGTASANTMTNTTVRTDSNGGFNLGGDYTCPSGDPLTYIVAKGGNPGLDGVVDSQAITLMALLGHCNELGSTHVIINEETTVAAVWALAPFMSAYDHVGTTSTNATGLTNAFAMAANLASIDRGFAPGDAPDGATIPTAELNTLADVLAACVNTPGGTPGDHTPCGNLFGFTTVGTNVPNNTVDAALSIALHPASHVSDIFDLLGSTPPFQSTLPVAPNDWTVAVNFTTGTRSTSGMAFDATGNLWIVAPDALYELGPQGTLLNSFDTMAGNQVAIDANSNVWVSTASNTLAEMPTSSSAAPAFYAAPNTPNIGVNGLALDGNGNAWYTCSTCSAVYELSPSGTYLGSAAAAGTSVLQTNISIDPSENVWLGNFDYAQVNVFKNDLTTLPNSPFSCGDCGHPAYVANDHDGNAWIVGNNLTKLVPGTGYTNFESQTTGGGGLFSPAAVAIDGAGNAWVANTVGITGNASAGSVSEFTNAGGVVTPDLGYVSESLLTPLSIAVDGSGSVWVRNTGNATVTAFVGAGVPVVTPLALGVKNNTLGSKP